MDPKIIESLGAVGTLAVVSVMAVRAIISHGSQDNELQARLAAIEEEQRKLRDLLEN